MTGSLVLAIVLQTVAISVILYRLRGSWLRSGGFWFLLAAWLYHAGCEIANWFAPGWNPYRALVADAQVEQASIFAGFAMLAFACAYAVAWRPVASRAVSPRSAKGILDDWRPLALAAIPLYLLALTPTADRQDLGYWASGLIDQFVIMTFVLLSLALSRAKRTDHNGAGGSQRRVLLVLFVQSVALTFLGIRTAVGIALIMFLSGRSRYQDQRSLLKTSLVGFAVLLAAALAISASRATVGREDMTQGAATRARSLASGLSGLMNPGDLVGDLLADSVYRIDGNSFTALILDRLSSGVPPIGTQLITNTVLLAAPSVIYPAKLDLPLEVRNEKALIGSHFAFFDMDYVPTLFTMLLASFGVIGAIAAAAAVGLGYALADRWLARRNSTYSTLLALGLIQCALQIEQGVVIYLIVLRGVLTIAIAAAVIDRFRPLHATVEFEPPMINRGATRAPSSQRFASSTRSRFIE